MIEVLLLDFNMGPCSIIDDDGNTPLHIAAAYDHKGIVLLLLSSGCPIDCITSKDRLHYI